MSTIISPLNRKLKESKFQWHEHCSKTLENVWAVLYSVVTLSLPDPNTSFVLHADASSRSIVGVLTQGSNLIRLFNAKLSSIEKRYSAIEKETIAIVKNVLSFRCLLANATVYVFTDNKNITGNTSSLTSRTQRWKLVLSEFDLRLVYKPGKDNKAADFLSRLETDSKNHSLLAQLPIQVSPSHASFKSNFEEKINLTSISTFNSSVSIHDISKYKLVRRDFADSYYHVDNKNRIFLPPQLRSSFISLVHKHLLHSGVTQLYFTISCYLFFPNIKKEFYNHIKNCDDCNFNKKTKKAYGKIVGALSESVLLRKISSDIFGPIRLEEYLSDGNGWIITFID